MDLFDHENIKSEPFMQTFSPLKTLLLLMPLLEIAGFIIIGGYIGVFATLLLIILSTMLGVFILRLQGLGMLNKMYQETRTGMPQQHDTFGEGLKFLGGLLLLLPGFITDTIGLVLQIPQVRQYMMRRLIANDVIHIHHL